ncbi:MAG TPA: RDD family protein [Pilimelia sp.]|nr:RDD family protein [Pilimelia sp.]
MRNASWGARLGAYLIDSLIVAPFSIIGYVLDGPETGEMWGGPLYSVFSLLGVIVWGYNRWYQAGRTGRSWGRRALSISLGDEASGQPIGAGRAFLRDLAHILDALPCLIGFLWPLWDAKKQTFADKLVKTVVTA